MLRFLVRRLGQGIGVLLGLTIVTFLFLHMLPGGPARALLGAKATPETVAALNRSLGLDRPLPVQYLQWLGRLLHGDLGESYQQGQSVGSLLAQRLPPTLLLVGTAVVLSLLIAIPLGVYQATHRNRLGDYLGTLGGLLGYSMPVFWFGLLLIMVFSLNLDWFPAGGIVSPRQSMGDVTARVQHLVLPVAMLSVAYVATWSRYVRASMLDVLGQDFVRMAEAKGAKRSRVLYAHALPNALISTVTLVGTSLPFVLSGSLVAEVVFNYQGMGLLFWNAAQVKDFPVLMGTVVLLGFATVAGSILADVVNAVLDPRIRRRSLA
ncbi:ABC transporter permease [Dactylosporangium sp. CA-233914]|uniref:ABC transporter permease n=1 Tax=Dactylosporangium sp. CA-233914 TaxID=3239934 RepID=UPI003D8A904C